MAKFSRPIILLSLIALACLVDIAESAHKCVWIRGVLKCKKDENKHFNVEVRVYDRDGMSFLKVLDPDDLMGVTFSDVDGSFQLDGCGDDFNWIPGIANNPDPFVRIIHYCNSPKGEVIELPEFNTWVPQTHDVGILVLDEVKPDAPRQKDVFGKLLDRYDAAVKGNGTFRMAVPELDSTRSSTEGSVVRLSGGDSNEATDEAKPVSFTLDDRRVRGGAHSRDKYRTSAPDATPPEVSTVSGEDV